ncbi:unnamed protein product [Owenia fusiformis]|uniref:Uncharacterized protein n=1 Tax=Owenia fusiformis TaxID=6347 RepID=A0A8J1T4K0_OWEFU|nr:unnamed protein product [Owenia fusiformis]
MASQYPPPPRAAPPTYDEAIRDVPPPPAYRLYRRIASGNRLQSDTVDPKDIGQSKSAIYLPRMNMCWAVVCCIFNFIFPGLGTLISGFSVCFCCVKTDDLTKSDMVLSVVTCTILGLLQMALTPLIFFGWIWSCLWGCAFIGASDTEYHGSSGDNNGESTAPTSNNIVSTQPYPCGSSPENDSQMYQYMHQYPPGVEPAMAYDNHNQTVYMTSQSGHYPQYDPPSYAQSIQPQVQNHNGASTITGEPNTVPLVTNPNPLGVSTVETDPNTMQEGPNANPVGPNASIVRSNSNTERSSCNDIHLPNSTGVETLNTPVAIDISNEDRPTQQSQIHSQHR